MHPLASLSLSVSLQSAYEVVVDYMGVAACLVDHNLHWLDCCWLPTNLGSENIHEFLKWSLKGSENIVGGMITDFALTLRSCMVITHRSWSEKNFHTWSETLTVDYVTVDDVYYNRLNFLYEIYQLRYQWEYIILVITHSLLNTLHLLTLCNQSCFGALVLYLMTLNNPCRLPQIDVE